MMIVMKRDGRTVNFDKSKVYNAISKAICEVEKCESLDEKSVEICNKIANEIECISVDSLSVEEIQDIVENLLNKYGRSDIANSYHTYRTDRCIEREKNSTFMKNVTAKLTASNVENQNANVDEKSFGGRLGAANSELTKKYALDYIISPMAKNNHLNNEIYIHDLDHYAIGDHNCLTIPFDDLLANGFNTRQTDVRPANSINTAFQLVAVIFQLQSLQQFGGVSASHLDHTMIPYVRKSFYKHYNDIRDVIPFLKPVMIDKKSISETSINNNIYKGKRIWNFINRYVHKKALKRTKKEVNQAVEGLYHNLNTLQSRSGNQLPFTSINYGTCTLPEGRMITKALLEGCIKGVGKFHKTSIFPCGIFQYKKGVNRKKGDPNYDLYKLALKSTSQRLYPNYANCDWSGNAGYDKNDPKTFFSTMG